MNKGNRAGLDEALRHFQVAIDADTTFAPAYVGLASTYEALGLVFYGAPPGETRQKTVAAARKALELDPRQYEVRFELIGAYRELGNLAEAAAQLDVLQDSRPTDPRVFYVTGLLDTDRNDLNSALKNFNEAITRDPTMFAAWQDLGLAYMKANRWTDAMNAFAELVRRQPNSVEAAYFHASALYNSDKTSEAESEARRTLRLDAGAVEAHTLLVIILASRGNANSEAADALSQAIALNPNSFDAQLYLGRVQYSMKDYAGAAKSFRAAVTLNPRHAEARFFLGTTLELAGDSNAAMSEYQELIKAQPDSAMGQLGLGALLVKQGRLDEAVVALRRAVALNPKEFEAHWALGRALALKERYAEAVQSFQTAISLAPNRSDAHYQLGLALRRLGRTEEANREFAIVERLNSEFRTSTNPKQ